jgi:hypothetical protein
MREPLYDPADDGIDLELYDDDPHGADNAADREARWHD